MKLAMPDADAVRAAMEAVLAEVADAVRRATVTAVERRLDVTHATFYRHHQDLITGYFQPRATPASQPEIPSQDTGDGQNNLRRLRQKNADLRRTLHLYGEAVRQLTLENDVLRQRGTPIALPTGRCP
ncbi:hypothetical protein AB0I94_37770 [Streptomyces sp. NPDC050147]|uniref:hypothetical protein n=1 Tax=Streptomyces sp. NPDC050147 TaxID=3155513 RepID=UPI00344390CD